MIHIFVKEDYNKETLGDLLNYINTTVDRKLTYGVNIVDNQDVVVETDDPINEEIALELSGTSNFKDDLCILVGEGYCKAFMNGHLAIIRTYVERMI